MDIPQNFDAQQQQQQQQQSDQHPWGSPPTNIKPEAFSSFGHANDDLHDDDMEMDSDDNATQQQNDEKPESSDLMTSPATPALDENGQPIKVRKKPGRKPNPASPALRKAQNRAAQRAFRERKEKHLRDLETTIRTLREQKSHAVKELHGMKSKLDSYKAEVWYLKGVCLTLQFVCLHHNIHIPTHSPYLTEEALSEMAKTAPHAIEAYVNAYTRNNAHLKPTMASHISNNRRFADDDKQQGLSGTLPHQQNVHNDTSALYVGEDTINTPSSYQAMAQARSSSVDWVSGNTQPQQQQQPQHTPHHPPIAPNTTNNAQAQQAQQQNMPGSMRLEQNMSMAQWLQQQGISPQQLNELMQRPQQPQTSNVADPRQQQQQQQQQQQALAPNQQPQDANGPSSLSTLQRIRLQMRIQQALATGTGGKSHERLQPTILQLAIPHDPRIDLIPTPHMRDRMILFRDQINYDECFDLLLNGTRYLGGDPTMSENWELDPSFLQEYWYLMLGYDLHKTNRWRRARGLPELPEQPSLNDQWLSNLQYQHPFMNNAREESLPPFVNDATIPPTAWADDIIRQMVEGMPTLQPVVNNNYPFDIQQQPEPQHQSPPPPPTLQQQQHLPQHPHQPHPHQTPQQQSHTSPPPPNPIMSPESHPFYTHLLGTPPEARTHRRSPSIGAMMKLMDSLTTSSPHT